MVIEVYWHPIKTINNSNNTLFLIREEAFNTFKSEETKTFYEETKK